MTSTRPYLAAAFLALAGSVIPVSAQTAAEIIDRHIAALGGRDALEIIETMKYIRTVQNTEDGRTTVQSRTVLLTRRPYLYRTERTETGRVNVSDGTRAWRGVRQGETDGIEWEESPRVQRLRDLDFDRPFGSFIDFERKGHSASYAGETELDGIALETVLVIWKDGGSWEYYFHPSTGLCYGWDASPGDPGGLIRVDDYQRVGDILLPHRNMVLDSLPDGSVRIHQRLYSDFELNLELSETLFRPGR